MVYLLITSKKKFIPLGPEASLAISTKWKRYIDHALPKPQNQEVALAMKSTVYMP